MSLIEGSTIRFATVADLKFLLENSYISSEIVKRKIEWQEMIVCELNERTIGFLQLEYLWSAVPYIALIRVVPEYRRQGVGKRLLAFAEEFLRDKEYIVLRRQTNRSRRHGIGTSVSRNAVSFQVSTTEWAKSFSVKGLL